MERFKQDMVSSTGSLGVVIEESAEFLETDFPENEPEHEEVAPESVWTDDPVRVYLREMGSVRLLSRQGEIDLARRMERGTTRLHKALSRLPLIWRTVASLHEDVRKGSARLADFVEVGGVDEDVRQQASNQATRQLSRFTRAYKSVVELEQKIASVPERHVNLRAKLESSLPRLQVRCSQEMRKIAFRAAQWKRFRSV